MKKFLSLLLVAVMLLGITACGVPAEEATEAPAEVTVAPIEEVTVAPAETEAEEPSVRMPMNMELPAIGESSGEDVKVPVDAPRTAMGEDKLAPNAMKSSADPIDPYRPWYDLGSARQLEGAPFFLCIFLDDNNSSWTNWEANSFLDEKFHPGMGWLCQQAAGWGVHLEYTAGYYVTDAAVTVRYNGTIGDFNGGLNNDVMEQVALSLGFANQEALHQRMLEWSGKDQVAYVVVMNKPGRSYAMMDWYNDGYDYMEYCMLFAEPSYVGDLVYDCPPATVAHEVLHMFGAEDFYAEGTQRNNRAVLAGYHYPYDIMYQTYYDINYNSVGQFTAYTVGWTDYTPGVCYSDDWWR